MKINEGSYLMHYGILRKSGRYPWGSGENPYQRSKSFLDYIKDLFNWGMSEAEIAKGLSTEDEPFTTTQLRATRSIARNMARQHDINYAQKLKDKGYSNVAIGKEMGINESSVRSLLAPGAKDKADALMTTADMLKRAVADKKFVDVGKGVENQIGLTKDRLKVALEMLKAEGYEVHSVQVDQIGTNQKTTVKVLAPEGTKYKDIVSNMDQIQQIQEHSNDNGRSFLGLHEPMNVDSKRLAVNYAEQGGDQADGVIYVRPGVEDLSLGKSRYAQVRIAIDGTHFIKGMAVYKDDLPDGVDLMFNTNKSDTGNKLDALKKMKTTEDGSIDLDNPFGSSIKKQLVELDESGKERLTSAMNIIYEEGEDWNNWSRNISRQTLSKQSPKLAKQQLDLTYQDKRAEFEEISSLTNPAVKRKLLDTFADSADAASVHLKAAALPNTAWHVLLPFNGLKENEVYAPNYKNGEKVALIRYPHGGTFEIPELVVNNNHRPAKDMIGRAPDAVGINHKVAGRLSGADFDGDTVLVIPNDSGKIKTSPPLEDLKTFDPKAAYPGYEGMEVMSARQKALEMGNVSNLITDMTIQGANTNEIAKAVKHSMVVIDAEKHGLDYKKSALDNSIRQLKEKYQGGANRGASTIISKAEAEVYVPKRRPLPARKGGPIDKATGRRLWEETGESYVNSKGKTIVRKQRSKQLAEVDDAHALSSGTTIEKVYADHSNRLKSLANQARKEMVNTPPIKRSPSAYKAYSNEVSSLNAKLNTALKNKPLERQAQLLANATVQAKRRANPKMEPEVLKKIKYQALNEMRNRTGAGKQRINIEPREWEAIQSGAVSNYKLEQILDNADLDQVKELATPRSQLSMTPAKIGRARAMLSAGYTQAEVAQALGVSVSTINKAL